MKATFFLSVQKSKYTLIGILIKYLYVYLSVQTLHVLKSKCKRCLFVVKALMHKLLYYEKHSNTTL